ALQLTTGSRSWIKHCHSRLRSAHQRKALAHGEYFNGILANIHGIVRCPSWESDMSNRETRPELHSSRECPAVNDPHLLQRLGARTAEVGGIPVHRILPQRQRRLIGAWCFLDHAGPAVSSADDAGSTKGMRVGPHPHTCLQTFTWMLAGEILHRDSLGSEQIIRPGELSMMTTGHSIAQTEASLADARELHAVELWIAQPHKDRDTRPRFDHYDGLPRCTDQGLALTLLTGAFMGHQAPTLAFSPLV